MSDSVATTTATDPLRYPAGTRIDRDLLTGYLWTMVPGTTANTYDLYRSTNEGVAWSLITSLTRANVSEMGSIFIGNQNWLHWCYRTNETSQDRIYYRRFRFDTFTWEAEVALSTPANGGVAGSAYTGLDLVVAVGNGGTEYVAVAVGTIVGANQGVTILGAYTLYNGGTYASDPLFTGYRQWLFTGSGHTTPSIDLEHNADGKTSANGNLWVAFGRTGAYVAKLAWNGNGWTGPTTPVTLTTGISARDYMPGRWDGTRFCVAVPSGSTVVLYERDRSNTTTVMNTSGVHPQGTIRSLTLGYNAGSGDARVFAVGTTINDLYYVDFIRATGTWSGWTAVSTDDIVGTNVDNFSVRRSTVQNARYSVAHARSGAPQIQHTLLTLTYAPLVPTWNLTGAAYSNGGGADVTSAIVLDWDFHDPDPTDTQSAYALSRQIGAGALNYWRASDSSWQVAEVQNTSGTTGVTIPTVWAADGNTVTFKVKTWDSTSTASAYSAALVVIASTAVNPTITAPAATIATDTVTVTWTVAEQTAFRVTLELVGVQVYDSGWIQSTALTWTVPTHLDNAVSYTAKLQTRNNEGLAGTIQSAAFTVAFAAPRVPTLTASPAPALGYISVAVNNPDRAFVAVGTAASANNASVVPGLPAGMTPDVLQLLVCVAAIRNSGTGTVNTIAGWTSLVNFGNVRAFAKLLVTGDTAPTVAFTGGVAGADTSAQIAGFLGFTTAVHGAGGTVLNGSAQNIATPAATITLDSTLVLAIGWKQSITTGATPPAGFTEIFDINAAAGSGQALTVAYQIQNAATSIGTSSFTMAGGVSAISRGIIVPLVGAPDVTSNDIYRREAGDTSTGIRVATAVANDGSGNDFRARSGTAYEYRILARGANGTSTYGAWTP